MTPTLRRRRVASELRRLREAAGLTCEDVAGRLECSASKISRIETGRVLVSPRDVRDMLVMYGVPAGERDALIQLARESRRKGWWEAYADALQPHLATYLGLESAASEIRSWKAGRVHALLQTEDYARAVVSAARTGAAHPGPERSVALLQERQRRAAASSPRLQVVQGEAALRLQVGGPEVLRAQIEHLIELSTRPGVLVQVMPYSGGVPLCADLSFTIMGFPDPCDPDVVAMGYLTGMLWIEDPGEVGQYRDVFHNLQAAALPPEASIAFMASLLEEKPPRRLLRLTNRPAQGGGARIRQTAGLS